MQISCLPVCLASLAHVFSEFCSADMEHVPSKKVSKIGYACMSSLQCLLDVIIPGRYGCPQLVQHMPDERLL